ncbi:MAG: hypothetical protein ACE366_19465 [Bradymonadia bacterium]
MKQSNPHLRRQMQALCAELGPEDGQDPYLFHQANAHPRHRGDHKTLQLCGQVARAIDAALAAAEDHTLHTCRVARVEPAPNARRLRATLVTEGSVEIARLALDAAEGWLRREVAAAVHRRKAPHVLFMLQATMEGER